MECVELGWAMQSIYIWKALSDQLTSDEICAYNSKLSITNLRSLDPESQIFSTLKAQKFLFLIQIDLTGINLDGHSKVHIFWEGHKILQTFHQLFLLCTASQMIGGGLLRIYEL